MDLDRQKEKLFQKVEVNPLSTIHKVIAVMSGKGGVGKSSVTSLVATSLSRKGKKVGILDADFTGPSIPKIFGINEKMADFGSMGIFPVSSAGGIKVMSINLLLQEKDSPVVWRGPLLASKVKEFFSDVVWGELDYLLIDLPPGTGDVPLTIMQSLPLDGVIVVSSPQDLVKLIVTKSIKMAQRLNIPLIGMVENMSYLECPDCKKIIKVFGESRIKEAAEEAGIPVLAQIPVDPEFAGICDQGKIEDYLKIMIKLPGIE